MMQPRAAMWMWHWDTSKRAGGFGLVGVSWGWTLGKGRCDHNLLLLCTNTADALISSFSSSQQCFEHPHPSGPEVHDSVWTQVISGTAVGWFVCSLSRASSLLCCPVLRSLVGLPCRTACPVCSGSWQGAGAVAGPEPPAATGSHSSKEKQFSV